MALSEFQRGVCQLLAGARLSRDVDVFHDTLEALDATWQADRTLLTDNAYALDVVRERPGFVEVVIHRGGHSVEMQWVRDSAFRFFPLTPHPDFGLVLHPFDLATNKVLALVGRVEVRDWIDTLTCHHKLTPLGLLAWAACGKDEGWNPQLIVDEAARTAHYSRAEIHELDWNGAPPDFTLLKTQWREAVNEARSCIELLPPERTGYAVLDVHGTPFQGNFAQLQNAMASGTLRFHEGYIGGAWPQIKDDKSKAKR
jgi:hypothetical protein